MLDIPKPQVLDPDRPLRHRGTEFTQDDRPEAEVLSIALHESCEYAEQLWDDLDAMRRYLLESLPPVSRVSADRDTVAASPTGPDDEQGWQNWINAFAEVTSVLCGPHGDSGLGLRRAREEAQSRRAAAVRRTGAARRGPEPATDASPDGAVHRPAEARWSPARVAGGVAVGALALRGLRRPRG